MESENASRYGLRGEYLCQQISPLLVGTEPGSSRVVKSRRRRRYSAHKANGLPNNTRKRMNDFHNWFKTVDQLAISVSIIFEFFGLIFEQLKDLIRRMAGSKLVNDGVLDWVDPDLLGIVGEGCIKDGLE